MMAEQLPHAFYSFSGSAQELSHILFGADAQVLLGSTPLSCIIPEPGSIVDISLPTYGGVNPDRIKADAYIQHMARILGDPTTKIYSVWGDGISSALIPLPEDEADELVEQQDAFIATAMRAENDAASMIAQYLICHPLVVQIFYPGLRSDESFAAGAQALICGFGNAIDFRLAGCGDILRVCASADDPFAQIEEIEALLGIPR